MQFYHFLLCRQPKASVLNMIWSRIESSTKRNASSFNNSSPVIVCVWILIRLHDDNDSFGLFFGSFRSFFHLTLQASIFKLVIQITLSRMVYDSSHQNKNFSVNEVKNRWVNTEYSGEIHPNPPYFDSVFSGVADWKKMVYTSFDAASNGLQNGLFVFLAIDV